MSETKKEKRQRVVVGRGRSAQHEAGVLIPEDAKIVGVSLDALTEHGYVDYYTVEVVEVDADESEAEAEADDSR